jgi:hypothetical protein
VAKAGKFAELTPLIIDLILVVIIWVGVIYSRIAFDLNKWISILLWVVFYNHRSISHLCSKANRRKELK